MALGHEPRGRQRHGLAAQVVPVQIDVALEIVGGAFGYAVEPGRVDGAQRPQVRTAGIEHLARYQQLDIAVGQVFRREGGAADGGGQQQPILDQRPERGAKDARRQAVVGHACGALAHEFALQREHVGLAARLAHVRVNLARERRQPVQRLLHQARIAQALRELLHQVVFGARLAELVRARQHAQRRAGRLGEDLFQRRVAHAYPNGVLLNARCVSLLHKLPREGIRLFPS